jgi:hypothetical protein
MFGAAFALLAAVGCGGSSIPPAKVTQTQSAISAAEAVGAREHPRAALHLKLARDQMAGAEALMRDGDDEEARLVLDRANADAELALVLTRSAERRQEAERAIQELKTLNGGE